MDAPPPEERMAIMPEPIGTPDPASVRGATFAHTGPERVVEAIKRRLREAEGPVSEDVLVTEFGPKVHYTDAARAWMDQYRFRLPRAIKRNPDLADVDPERAFSVGTGRPAWETQNARYDDGARTVIVNYILGRRAAFERVTATGQPYPDARGHKLGLVYWRLAAPKLKPAPRPRPARVSVVPVPAADGDIGAITARINGLQHAPLEQGKLLLQVSKERLYLDLDDVPDFEAYIRRCCAFDVRYAYRLINLARVKAAIMEGWPIGHPKKVAVPEHEWQARALVPLLKRPDDLRRAWQIAVDTAPVRERDGSPNLTARHLKEVLQRLGLAAADREPVGGAADAAPPLEAFMKGLAGGAYDGDLEALGAAIMARGRAVRGDGGMPCPIS
jgi:hypothetical protein